MSVPGAGWSIRPAVVGDALVIAAHRFDERPAPATAVEIYADWLRPRLADGRYLGRVAVHDDQVIGGAGAVLLDWGPRRDSGLIHRIARINNVHTEVGWRRQGVARALLRAVLDDCRGAGILDVTLSATESAAALYRALGFADKTNEMTLRLRDADLP